MSNYEYDWNKYSPDHVQDLGWNGPDTIDNLWPLESSLNLYGNESYGQEVSYQEDGTEKKSDPYKLVDKWFIIDSIGDF